MKKEPSLVRAPFLSLCAKKQSAHMSFVNKFAIMCQKLVTDNAIRLLPVTN